MIVGLDEDDTVPTANRELLAELVAALATPALIATDWGAATTPGRRRAINEDAWGEREGAFVVADGMGGHGGGATAARLAIAGFLARLRAADEHPDWRATIHAVNAEVKRAGEDEALGRVGTTLLAAVVGGPIVTLIHVGDSRAYRLSRSGGAARLDVLTHDHTVGAELLAAGLDVGEYRQRGVALHGLTSFVGLDEDSLRVDVVAVAIRPADRFLLCTDGVHRQVEEDELREAMQLPTCQASADRLVRVADAAGGRDNATAVVVGMGAIGSPGSDRPNETGR